MSDNPILINEAGDSTYVPNPGFGGEYFHEGWHRNPEALMEAVGEQLYPLTGVHLALFNMVDRIERCLLDGEEG